MGIFSIRISVIFYFCAHKGIAHTLRKGIVGGEDVQENEYTYQVSLMFRNDNICGGAIIGDQFILTAAHCVIDDDGEYIQHILTALIGSNDFKNLNVFSMRIIAESIYVAKEFIPPNPKKGTTHRPVGDIAVLKLRDPIRLAENPHLKKLEIADDWTLSYVNEDAIITGFGYNILDMDPKTGKKTTMGRSFGKMRWAETKVISNNDCDELFYNKIWSSNICARMKQRTEGNPEGVCSGDSGSPLVLGGNTVIGVLSSSPMECEEVLGAGVYTRVSSFRTFIQNAMSDYQAPNMRLGVWYMFDELYGCSDFSPLLIEKKPGE